MAVHVKERGKLKFYSIGNCLKPNFAKNGELIGFEIRYNLINTFYMSGGFKFSTLRRILTTCLQLNKIIKYGAEQDFSLYKVKEAEAALLDKHFNDKKIQVDKEDLRLFIENSK